MLKDWKNIVFKESISIIDAIGVIDKQATGFCVVVDEAGQLVGTVTDGDIRRGMLKGIDLQESLQTIMFRSPVTMRSTDDVTAQFARWKTEGINYIPVVDEDKKVVGLEIREGHNLEDVKPHMVVLMVGGRGERLRPLTDNCPKPLLKIGDKPILEIILEGLIKSGFREFYFAINYKGDMIRDYFGDGSKWNVSVRYLEEQMPLGTAGALGLIKEELSEPVLVMNGDLMTTTNYSHLIEFHEKQDACATMCLREYSYALPFGQVTTEHALITGITEKPEQRVYVNAGIYVITPRILSEISAEEYLDMPDLFNRLIERGERAAAFLLREEWFDIGRHSEYLEAQDAQKRR